MNALASTAKHQPNIHQDTLELMMSMKPEELRKELSMLLSENLTAHIQIDKLEDELNDLLSIQSINEEAVVDLYTA